MGILQILPGFYEEAEAGKPKAGDIYWVPVQFQSEVPMVLEVGRYDPKSHDVVEFSLCQMHGNHFKPREGKLPVKLLKLEHTEEAIICKAKRRPAVVICGNCVPDISKVLTGSDKRLAAHLERDCFLVAPLYSTSTPAAPGSFMPKLVARIRSLLYPHLMCLPPLGSNEAEPGEVVRLDHLMATSLGRGCERSRWRLHPEALTLLNSQLRWALEGSVSPDLQPIVDLARETLPV
jgi:hypothetical protein